MSLKPPPTDPWPDQLTYEMVALDREDFEIIEKKIRPLKKAPYFFRIGIPAFIGTVAIIFYVSGNLDWMFAFFAVFGLAMIGMAEWAIRYYLDKLKKDLLNREKRVWKGTLYQTFRQKNNSSKNRASQGLKNYVWQVSGKEFSVPREDYERAAVGDQVEIEQLPESDLVLRARKIT